MLIGSVALVNWFSDKCLSKLSLRLAEQYSSVTGNSSAFETGTLNITTFYYSHLGDGDFFCFLDSLCAKEYVCVCNLMNESVVLFTSLLSPNSKNKKEKETTYFLEAILINALLQNSGIRE